MIRLSAVRTLTLEAPSQAGRPSFVSAASGLVRAGQRLYVVADDENHLAIFPAEGTAAGRLAKLLEGELPLREDPRKRAKPDFESLVRLPSLPGVPHGALLALGSCSKPNRCRGILLGLDGVGDLGGTTRSIDLTPLRECLETRFGRLNIEGAVVAGGELVLLQRGNKGDRRNACIRLRLDEVAPSLLRRGEIGLEALVDIREVELGSVEGVPLTFSDGAALPDGRIVFAAIAEDTDDSYEDGNCMGSGIGILDAAGAIERFEPLQGRPKIEGVVATMEEESIRLLLVTDADDAAIPAALLEGRIPARA